MKSEIILVQPKAGEWEMAEVRPPNSLLAVAATPHHKGYKIRIIDQRIDKNWKETLRKSLNDAIIVGTTAMTGPQIKYALEASKIAKLNSDVPVVWGGIHASLLPEETIQNKWIDIVMKGEGDYAFTELVEAIEGSKEIEKVKGIYYKHKGKIKTTGERPLIDNLDKLYDYPYSLIDLQKYYSFKIGKSKSISLMTSRGCPFRCAFCYNTVYYKNSWRGMSAERTIDLIKRVVDDYGIRNIFFEDDNFCANIGRFKEIVKKIIQEKIDISWGLLGVRVNTIKAMSDELLKDSVKAGCMNVDVGIESGSERMLKLITKDILIEDILSVNRRLAKYFDKTKYTFIMGMPTETEEELLQSVRFAIRLSKENPHALPLFFTYCAYPGTKLYDLAVRHGLRVPKNLEEWTEINYEKAYMYYPWLNKKRIRMIRNFEFTSLFSNKNNQYKINSKLFRMLARMYRPIAKLRFENNIYQFPLERVAVREILAKW